MNTDNNITKIFILLNNELKTKYFNLSSKLLCNTITLVKSFDSYKFQGYFKKTLSIYPRFKLNHIKDEKEVSDYFKRCHIISLLQLLCMIKNCLPQFMNSTGLIKIGPSKNGRKSCCIIDDSTILDTEINEIRETKGTLDEQHRGYRLFYSLNIKEQEDVILAFDYMIKILDNILIRISKGYYIIFDPIIVLQKIVNYCDKNNIKNLIDYLAWEIHDSPHLLSYDEKINIFKNYDMIYDLWRKNFIANEQGKLRIFILSIYFMDLVSSFQINL